MPESAGEVWHVRSEQHGLCIPWVPHHSFGLLADYSTSYCLLRTLFEDAAADTAIHFCKLFIKHYLPVFLVTYLFSLQRCSCYSTYVSGTYYFSQFDQLYLITYFYFLNSDCLNTYWIIYCIHPYIKKYIAYSSIYLKIFCIHISKVFSMHDSDCIFITRMIFPEAHLRYIALGV